MLFCFDIERKPITCLELAVGNIFNNSTDKSLDESSGTPVHHDMVGISTITPDASLMVKYMLSKDFGLRANIGLISRTNLLHKYVQDDKLAFTTLVRHNAILFTLPLAVTCAAPPR